MALGVALFTARVLGAHFISFLGTDEVSLAAGSATLVNDSLSGISRYGPQAGYYRLIEGISLALAEIYGPSRGS